MKKTNVQMCKMLSCDTIKSLISLDGDGKDVMMAWKNKGADALIGKKRARIKTRSDDDRPGSQ